MWKYKGKDFDETSVQTGHYGMIYKITVLLGDYKNCYYIGSKQFVGVKTKRLSKKRSVELYSGRGRKPTKEKVEIKKDWFLYATSSKLVKSLIEDLGRDAFLFEILDFGTNKSDLLYKELQYILKNNWLSEKCLNMALKFSIYKSQLIK